MAPFIAIFLITLLYFVYAMKWGVVRILASAIAIAAGMAAFFAAVNLGPPFINELFGLDLAWQAVMSGAGILAVIVYFISWAIFGFILKFLFNPDSFLNPLADGITGGILSLFASAVMAFLILTATRITGTLFEINYVASITQPSIVDADLSQLPERSRFTVWRDNIEKVPMIADLLDRVDPFSRRSNRNFGMMTLFGASQPAREFTEASSQMGDLINNGDINVLLNSAEFARQIQRNERVGLVLNREALEIASDRELKNQLKNLKIDRHIDEFITWLKTNKTPNF